MNLLPDILPLLDQAGYDIQLSDLREYSTIFDFQEIKEDSFAAHVWPDKHPKAGEPVMLRDYQIEIVNNFLKNPQSLQEIATGAGKTIMTAALSYSVEKYGRSIVIVPNKDLVTQTERDYINVGLDVGVYFGDRKEYGKTHTICTWQSLGNLLKKTKADEAEITIGEFLEGVVCVMVDEVHMAKADVLKELLTGVMSHIPIRWGLTGTIPKSEFDYKALFVSLGPVINKLSASELQDKGVLANCHVNIVQLQDKTEFTNYQSELKYLLENDERLTTICQLLEKIKESGNTLILVDRVSAGRAIQTRLSEAFTKSRLDYEVSFVSGETNLTERKEQYDEVATATNKVIVATYGVAAVGINIPRIFNLVLIEPGKSFVRVIQSIGRGIRKAEDKDFVQIWDITSSCKFAKRHLTQRKSFYKEANYPFDVEKLNYK
jgi:superfamily II DNA or RNA helicase